MSLDARVGARNAARMSARNAARNLTGWTGWIFALCDLCETFAFSAFKVFFNAEGTEFFAEDTKKNRTLVNRDFVVDRENCVK